MAVYYSSNDPHFQSIESPREIDIYSELGDVVSGKFIFHNIGMGNIEIQLSTDGTTYGNNILVKGNNTLDIDLPIKKVKLIYIDDSAYVIYAQD